jgi:hypothetical protein
MNYWYIWYETFEDDKSLGKHKYYYAYEHKSSAERRARQMFMENTYIPMTGSIISRKWIVSQTNPWDDRDTAIYTHTFKTKQEATDFLEHLDQVMSWYGIVLVSDFKNILGCSDERGDSNYGWFSGAFEEIQPVATDLGYKVTLPRPLTLV